MKQGRVLQGLPRVALGEGARLRDAGARAEGRARAVELESVTCCGAGDIHEAEPDYYLHLNARILAYAAAEGVDTLLTVCNVCTLNLRQANFMLLGDSELRARVNENLVAVGVPAYERDVDVRHLLWEIAEGEGYEQLKQRRAPRPQGPEDRAVLRLPDPAAVEDPRASRIPTGRGRSSGSSRPAAASAIDYPAKIKCCGFPIIQAREETALGELIQPIEQANEAGADAIVTPCPLCHLSLDAWQSKLKAATGRDFEMPILHLSQLVGVAAGSRGGGAEVQAARRLGASRSSRSSRSELAFLAVVVALAVAGRRVRLVRGGLGAPARARAAGRRAPARARRAADRAPLRLPPRGALARRRAPSPVRSRGSRSASPTSSASPATCLRARAARLACGSFSSCCRPTRTSCSGTTTSRSRATRSRSPHSWASSRAGRCSRDESADDRAARRAGGDRGRRSAVVAREAAERASRRPTRRAGCSLCHFPRRARPSCSRGAWHLILAGHLHAGQIVLPYGRRGRLLLAHPARGLPAAASTGARAPRCTSRRGSGRRSCRSASSRGPRRPNSFYDAGDDRHGGP